MVVYSSDMCFAALILFLLFLSLPNRNLKYSERHFKRFVVKFNRSYLEEYLNFDERHEVYKKAFQNFRDTIEVYEGDELKSTKYFNYSNTDFLEHCLGIAPNEMKDLAAIVKRMTTLFVKIGIKPCSVPLRVDWRSTGIVTEIRNQGKCGSCYAHSVVASIESLLALQMNFSTPVALSVQQMLDCSGEFSNACLGGDTCELLEWLKKRRIQILPRNLYPDSDVVSHCRTKEILRRLQNHPKTVRIKQYACFNFTNNEQNLLKMIAKRGPLSASVDASLWKHYLGGIIKHHCDGPPNHSVQIVGYDLTVENPFYVVRNSWGSSFGIDGYAKIAIGGNICGIASEVALMSIAYG